MESTHQPKRNSAAGTMDGADAPGATDGERLLIRGASGLGWTSVEALRPDGLVLWAYEPHLLLNDAACGAGTVFVSTRVAYRWDQKEPAQIVALSARDGALLWRTRAERFRWRLVWMRLIWGLRVAFREFSLASAQRAVRSLRFAELLSLATDGDLIVACTGAVHFAFDAATGALRWVTPPLPNHDRRVFAMRGGRIYVAGERGGIEALDARTGRRRWVTERPLTVGLHVAANDAHVYIHAFEGRRGPVLATLSAEDGAAVQTLPVRAQPQGDEATPQVLTLTDEGVAILLRDRRLEALRLEDGEVLWRSLRLAALQENAAGRPVSVPQVAVSGEHLAYAYTAFDDTGRTHALHIGALDPQSGASLWNWRGPERPNPARGHRLVTAFGSVYLGLNDTEYAFGGDGTLLWTAPAGFTVTFFGPARAGGEQAG